MGYICQKEKKLEHVGILRLVGTLTEYYAREYYDAWEHYDHAGILRLVGTLRRVGILRLAGILRRVGILQRAEILRRVGTLRRAGILRQVHVENVVEEDNTTILRLINH